MNYADMNIYYGTKCKLFYEAYRTVTDLIVLDIISGKEFCVCVCVCVCMHT